MRYYFLPMKLTKNKKSDSNKPGGYGKNGSLILAGRRAKGTLGKQFSLGKQ